MTLALYRRLQLIAAIPVAACTVIGISSGSPAQAASPTQFGSSFTYNGKEYSVYLSDVLLSWSDARTFAQALSPTTDLASINDAGENAAIFAEIADASLWQTNGIGPYTGLFQLSGSDEPAGGWRWVDGTLASYTNWAPFSPDDFLGGNNVGGFYANQNFVTGIADTWGDTIDGDTLSDGSENIYRANSFVVETRRTVPPGENTSTVPGPLPALGALAGFGWSRRLRRRCIQAQSKTS
jgi:hypothetical protein